MISKYIIRTFLFILISFASFVEADEYVYSLRLGESFNSIRGKINFHYSTKSADGFSIVSLNLIPGAPRYTDQTTLIFYKEKLSGVIFNINPRITDFDSYEERNIFLTNSYNVLTGKLEKKYGFDGGNRFVSCGGRASYDFETCSAKAWFSDKHKLLQMNYSDGKIYQYIIHKKQFKSIAEFSNKVLLSIYGEHIIGLEAWNKSNKKEWVIEQKNSTDYDLATIEIEFSDVP